MYKEILIGTGNPGKLQEITEMLSDLPLKVYGINDFDIEKEVEETGQSFEENALLKAKTYFDRIGGKMPVLSDDSGIVVEVLDNELSVFTRRWGAGAQATDEEWLDYFMKRMSTETNRNAKFVSNVVFYKGGDYDLFEGECKGLITQKAEAPIKPGIPLSSVFKPNGFDKVFSAMSDQEKSKASHRGFAMNSFVNWLKQQY